MFDAGILSSVRLLVQHGTTLHPWQPLSAIELQQWCRGSKACATAIKLWVLTVMWMAGNARLYGLVCALEGVATTYLWIHELRGGWALYSIAACNH